MSVGLFDNDRGGRLLIDGNPDCNGVLSEICNDGYISASYLKFADGTEQGVVRYFNNTGIIEGEAHFLSDGDITVEQIKNCAETIRLMAVEYPEITVVH